MRFTSKEDIDIPIEDAFNMLSDYDFFERMAMRRGIEISRKNPDLPVGIGAAWELEFDWRGKEIAMDAEIVTFERPDKIVILAKSKGLSTEVEFELVALSKRKTRMHLIADVTASTLPARLLVQSMKLARGSIEKKFVNRFELQCRHMEDRYQMAS